MAKDYFQDITPPEDEPRRFSPRPGNVSQPKVDLSEDEEDMRATPMRMSDGGETGKSADATARGIRSISAPARARSLRPGGPTRMDQDIREGGPLSGNMPHRPRRFSRLWIGAIVSLVVLALVGALLFVFASTTVSVTPKTRTATLVASALSAHQVGSVDDVATGTLSYAVQTFDLEDSETVPAQGSTHVESKASGSITVYNAYSGTSVKLVKNTRFESPDGLIFRVLSDIVVPGKVGSTPGRVNVTVVADQPGEKYNVGPIQKFTLPGLKSTPTMYAGVYANSSAPISGGFVGEQPGTAPGALEAAIASTRERLEAKAHEAALGQIQDDTFIFPELMQITYESLPQTSEAGNSVRIHQKAHVEIPVFSESGFAGAIATAAFVNPEKAPVLMKPASDFAVLVIPSSGEPQVGVLNLLVSGSALIIWRVDTTALSSALAGKESGAFQGIVNGFSSIQEAHARIAPFWKSTFPQKASDVKIQVVEPAPLTGATQS